MLTGWRFFGASIFIAGVFLALLFVGVFNDNTPSSRHVFARLAGVELVLEVANTDVRRAEGLSGRKEIKPNEGMLFVFPEDREHGFWMKDMGFPIDILWLDRGYRIVDVRENVEPESYPKVFRPDVSARYTLELPAGFFAQYKLSKGMPLEILK